MKPYIFSCLLLSLLGSCTSKNSSEQGSEKVVAQANLKNDKVKRYSFLKDMENDSYFPGRLVAKGKQILINLCFQIEKQRPQNLDELYALTQAATGEFNNLDQELQNNGSELETVARESIGLDFKYIATAYGFDNADMEQLIATREW